MSADLPKLLFALLLLAVLTLALWARPSRPGRVAAAVRQGCRLSGWPGALLVLVLALAVFAVVVEDVVSREPDELVLRIDRVARQTARGVAAEPAVRAAAVVVSRLTGEGLVVLVLLVGGRLVVTRRRREAAILAAGTFSAWLLANALKLAFAVPRPGRPRTVHAISGYGFPSAHALVTLVACGLAAWLLGRHASPRARRWLYAAAATVAALSGTSRIVLNVHWASDVVAGLAIGIVWLTLVVLAVSRWESPTFAALASARAARD
jgi:membrane-associated phospholipid phosphatase